MVSLQVRLLSAAAICVAMSTALAGQSVSPRSPDAPPPVFRSQSAQTPPKAAADMQAVLDVLGRLGAKPVQTLTPAQARAQASPADAVRAVLKARGMPPAPDPSVVTREMSYGANPMQKARIYRPANAPRGPLPLVVYYHGGGWVIADLDVYDSGPRMLAKKLNALVVSVEYRHAPEFKFPAQHDDALSAYRWVLTNAAGWGGDIRRMAFAGESEGGNLAIVNAQIDPLLSDGINLAPALRRSREPVEQRTFNGVTHEFFGMGAVVNGAKMADDYAVARLRAATVPLGRR